ncbi:hypothetical protein STVA_04770 [Allostella vacuolata]|nr:hypothetical protein STVA_04770 [Stella vacuolata]
MPHEPMAQILLLFVIPIWILAGFADWLCHRASAIERTAGPMESVLHLLMLAEVGLPLLAGLLLEINALLFVLFLVGWAAHELTAFLDLRFAAGRRHVAPIEQHVHSYLGLLPLTALLGVIALHWGQFQALFGAGPEAADFTLRWKDQPLPPAYVVTVLGAVLILSVAPFVEELCRGLRQRMARPAMPRHDP